MLCLAVVQAISFSSGHEGVPDISAHCTCSKSVHAADRPRSQPIADRWKMKCQPVEFLRRTDVAKEAKNYDKLGIDRGGFV